MIAVYVLDYSSKKNGNACKDPLKPVRITERGLFQDADWKLAEERRMVYFNLHSQDVAECVDYELGYARRGYLPRYREILVWYSPVTPGRRVQVRVKDDGKLYAYAAWGPPPADDSDWPPVESKSALLPVVATDDLANGNLPVSFAPPEIPKDVVYESDAPSAIWIALGIGAIVGAGIGSYKLASWISEKRRGI